MTLCQFISFCIIQSILSLLLQFHCSLHLQHLHFYNPTTAYAWFHSEHLHISILRMCVRLCLHSSIFLLANIYVLISLQVRLEFSMSITLIKLLFFDVLLTVHLSIFISVINRLDAQNFCFTISLFHASTCFKHMCSSSGGQNCITQPPDDEHMCSKHVEA